MPDSTLRQLKDKRRQDVIRTFYTEALELFRKASIEVEGGESAQRTTLTTPKGTVRFTTMDTVSDVLTGVILVVDGTYPDSSHIFTAPNSEWLDADNSPLLGSCITGTTVFIPEMAQFHLEQVRREDPDLAAFATLIERKWRENIENDMPPCEAFGFAWQEYEGTMPPDTEDYSENTLQAVALVQASIALSRATVMET